MSDPRTIAPRFAIEGSLVGIERLGRGHIHDTFLLHFHRDAEDERFVLQRINHRVFPTPLDVMRNIEIVTEHLRAQLATEPAHEVERRCLRLIPSRDGATHVVAEDGALWRAYPFIEGSVALEKVETQTQAFVVARAFGDFVARLSDLAPSRLAETLPGFHDLPGRFDALWHAVSQNAAGRPLETLESDLARARSGYEHVASALGELPPLPRRVVHNDCKLNNVLLDAHSGNALCVIDLDTVMEGTLLADFGDLVRTAANPAAEDERELSRVDFDLPCFGALARGYVEGLAGALADEEQAALPLAGPTLALENALRFLTDHLDGDVYFSAQRENHNLDRARCQLKLLDVMLERLPEATQRVEAAVLQTGRSISTEG